MAKKEWRIPVHLEFADDVPDRDRFAPRLLQTGYFSLLCPPEEYFGTITGILLDGGDPSGFIADYEPAYEGTPALDMLVASARVEAPRVLFVYGAGTTEDEFAETARGISESTFRKHAAVILGYSGLNFYKKYLGGGASSRKALAEAYFYTGEASRAAPVYGALMKAYPAYGARMLAWCRILLGEGGPGNAPAFDILIQNRKAHALFDCLDGLPVQWRAGAEYWLCGQGLSSGRAMLNCYACAIGLAARRDSGRLGPMMARMQGEIATKLSGCSGRRRELWSRVWQMIELGVGTV